MSTSTVIPPVGFQLEQDDSSALQLPAGFQLEKPLLRAQARTQPTRSAGTGAASVPKAPVASSASPVAPAPSPKPKTSQTARQSLEDRARRTGVFVALPTPEAVENATAKTDFTRVPSPLEHPGPWMGSISTPRQQEIQQNIDDILQHRGVWAPPSQEEFVQAEFEQRKRETPTELARRVSRVPTLAEPAHPSAELDEYAFEPERIQGLTGHVYREKVLPEHEVTLAPTVGAAEDIIGGLHEIHEHDKPVWGRNPDDPYGAPVRLVSEEEEKRNRRAMMGG